MHEVSFFIHFILALFLLLMYIVLNGFNYEPAFYETFIIGGIA